MAFKNPIVYLSQLVADSITGAVINGGQIIGTAIQGVTIDATSTITGALVQTAASGMRWAISSIYLTAYTGNAAESAPGKIFVEAVNPFSKLLLTLVSPVNSNTGRYAKFSLGSSSSTAYLYGLADQFLSQLYTAGVGVYTTVIQADSTGTQIAGVNGGSVAIDSTGNVSVVPAAGKALTLGEATPTTGAIQGMDMGKVTGVVTSGSGGVLVNHGLGVVPTSIQVTPFMASANIGWRVTAMTTTTFTIGFFTCSTGAALVSTNVGFTWEVKA